MSLTKEATDTVILTEVQQRNDDFEKITYFRNTSSAHPRDCSCDVCIPLKFTDGGAIQENNLKTSLNWYLGE